MEHPRLAGLRERVSVLRSKEGVLLDELFGFAGHDKAATRAAITIVGREFCTALREVAGLRDHVEKLQDGRKLGEIFDADTIEEIVACEQHILDLYKVNISKMRDLMGRRTA
jgi:hypothetical protein